MNQLNTPSALTRYAEQLARVADPLLIHRMKSAGLNRANRRRLMSLSRKNELTAADFPLWLVAQFMAAGDEALA